MATSTSSACVSTLCAAPGCVPTSFPAGAAVTVSSGSVVTDDRALQDSLAFSAEHVDGCCETLVLEQSGRVLELSISNVSAGTVFFKLFNLDRRPTIGEDTPILTIQIRSGLFSVVEFGRVGKLLDKGISYAITGLMAPDDRTAIGRSVQVSMTFLRAR
jgi:hypothetical protein